MTRWKTILVPTDLSPAARGVLTLAAEIARDSQGRLVLLHVVQLPSKLTSESAAGPLSGSPLAAEGAELEAAAREELARLAQSTREAWPGVPVEALVQCGVPTAVIVDSIASLAPDLVVVGTHGRTGFAHLMLGSVAEGVVRASPVPVLTVRAPASDGPGDAGPEDAEPDDAEPAATTARATFQG